jgi:hypothetical protein
MQTEHMNLRLIILSLAMTCCTMTSAQEQETTFPFPAMPDSLRRRIESMREGGRTDG